jgi:hypothetical protein
MSAHDQGARQRLRSERAGGRAVLRRMAHSAAARLITQAAPIRTARLNSSGGPKTTSPIARAYTLLDAAQSRWRCVNAPHMVARVRAWATFLDAFLIEREDRRDAA